MKFLTNIIPLSNCPSPNWAFPCDAPNIPGPSHRLSGRCFMLRSRPPRNVGPSTSCAPPETPSGEGARNGPSTFSPERLCAAKGVLDMDVDMVLAHYALQNMHVLRIAYLGEQVATAIFQIALKNRIPVLGRPNYMTAQITYGMGILPVIRHPIKLKRL